jgi:hypothetical protein
MGLCKSNIGYLTALASSYRCYDTQHKDILIQHNVTQNNKSVTLSISEIVLNVIMLGVMVPVAIL